MYSVSSNSKFQSAPLTEARGDAAQGHRALELARCEVSIRSPHRSKGRHIGAHTHVISNLFQSAPLTEARGDSFPVLS